jgi:hypothetical protein
MLEDGYWMLVEAQRRFRDIRNYEPLITRGCLIVIPYYVFPGLDAERLAPSSGTACPFQRLKKGLVFRSLPTVVEGPCPGYTLTSSPKGKIFSITPFIN